MYRQASESLWRSHRVVQISVSFKDREIQKENKQRERERKSRDTHLHIPQMPTLVCAQAPTTPVLVSPAGTRDLTTRAITAASQSLNEQGTRTESKGRVGTHALSMECGHS